MHGKALSPFDTFEMVSFHNEPWITKEMQLMTHLTFEICMGYDPLITAPSKQSERILEAPAHPGMDMD